MNKIPEITQLSVVFVGDFNPRIFTPDWFVSEGLLNPDHVNDQSIEVVHPDISQFVTEWGSVSVNKSRFQVTSEAAPLVRVVDLASKLFGESLPHTPVKAFAINKTVHINAGSEEAMNNVGLKLAPHEPWGAWGEMFKGEGDTRGGLIKLEMIQKNMTDRDSGYIQARVEPSSRIKHGILISTNDHFSTTEKEKGMPAGDVAQLLSDVYSSCNDRADMIFNSIIGLVE